MTAVLVSIDDPPEDCLAVPLVMLRIAELFWPLTREIAGGENGRP